MRIAICDDEEVQRKLLTAYLQEWASGQRLFLETISFCNAENFLFHWEEDKDFDLLILDIEMGAQSGVELALKLRAEGEPIPILFITGYESYMAQGYEVSALHYLLKPLNKEKLFDVLKRLNAMQKPEKKLLFQTTDGSLSLLPSDIWYIEASVKQCVLSTSGQTYVLKHSITEVKKMLEKEGSFIACHRSYFVNLQHVSVIGKSELMMDNGVRIPVSRGSAKAVNDAFIRFYTPGRQ